MINLSTQELNDIVKASVSFVISVESSIGFRESDRSAHQSMCLGQQTLRALFLLEPFEFSTLADLIILFALQTTKHYLGLHT